MVHFLLSRTDVYIVFQVLHLQILAMKVVELKWQMFVLNRD